MFAIAAAAIAATNTVVVNDGANSKCHVTHGREKMRSPESSTREMCELPLNFD